MTAEIYFAFALVCLKNEDGAGCFEDLQKAHMIYENQLGMSDVKTKEVALLINSFDGNM